MLITPECYRDTYLKGKDAEGVRMEIDALRKGIENLKKRMESPAAVFDESARPGPDAELASAREYLAVAKKTFFALTAKTCESEEEMAAEFINERLESVREIDLTIGDYLSMRYSLSVGAQESTLKVSELHGDELEVKMETAHVLEALRSLRIGEWRDTYLPEHYGCSMADAEKWHVRIEMNDGGAPLFFDGIGVYPYNFKAFCHLMGVER